MGLSMETLLWTAEHSSICFDWLNRSSFHFGRDLRTNSGKLFHVMGLTTSWMSLCTNFDSASDTLVLQEWWTEELAESVWGYRRRYVSWWSDATDMDHNCVSTTSSDQLCSHTYNTSQHTHTQHNTHAHAHRHMHTHTHTNAHTHTAHTQWCPKSLGISISQSPQQGKSHTSHSGLWTPPLTTQEQPYKPPHNTAHPTHELLRTSV